MTEIEAIELAKSNLDQAALPLIAHTSASWVEKDNFDLSRLEPFFSSHEKFQKLKEKLLEQPQQVVRGWCVKFVMVKKDQGAPKVSTALFMIYDSGKIVGTPFMEGVL
jgi:hypothetical protein